MKKVSAIITTHNRCNFLKKAIESVLNQTYKNIECIVVDDNSEDNTKEYMEKLIQSNNSIKYIRIDKKNLAGGAYARNLGIREANGDYIAFLDDDDEWFEKKIEKQVKILEENNDVGLVVCGRRIEYNLGKTYENEETIEEGIKDYSKKILYTIIGVTSMLLVKRKILEDIGVFDENIKFWQEYDLTIRICQVSKVAFIRECLILYRVNLNDKNRKTNKFDEWIQTTEYVHEKYKNLIDRLSEEEQKKVEMLVCYDAVTRCNATGNKKKKRSYLKKIYELNPNIKNLIKYIFNIDKMTIVKIKQKINWRKKSNV
ncbi:MAG: glycosyltransferase family 2 protein [Clostridia bacterium]